MKRLNSSKLVTITLDRANELVEKARTSGHPNDKIELTLADLRRIIDIVADEAHREGHWEGTQAVHDARGWGPR